MQFPRWNFLLFNLQNRSLLSHKLHDRKFLSCNMQDKDSLSCNLLAQYRSFWLCNQDNTLLLCNLGTYWAICKIGVNYHVNCAIATFYCAIWNIQVGYHANCTIATFYLVFWFAIVQFTRKQFLLCNFLDSNLLSYKLLLIHIWHKAKTA